MSKSSKKFFQEIDEMILNQRYDEDVMNRLLRFIVIAKLLAHQKDKSKEVRMLWLNISIVGESLAKKLESLRSR